jgi:threonine dehydrogenase-like Zn-dependent dehydrogenase
VVGVGKVEIAERPLPELDPRDILAKVEMAGVCSGFATAVSILEAERSRVPFEKVVTHEFSLSRVQEALETARREDCVKAVLIPARG